MEVWARDVTSGAAESYHGVPLHYVTGPDPDLRQMGVHGDYTSAVVHPHYVAVAILRAREPHATWGHGADLGARGHLYVDTPVDLRKPAPPAQPES